MAGQTVAAYDRATQAVCRALCNDAGRETSAEIVAGGSPALFEAWVRCTLAGHGIAEQLNATDFAGLQRLMGR